MASLAQVFGLRAVEAVSISHVRQPLPISQVQCHDMGFFANMLCSCAVSFEESILSILPSALFLLLSIPRTAYLLRTPDKAKRRSAYTPKLVSLTLSKLQLV